MDTKQSSRNGKIELLRVLAMMQILFLHYLLMGGVLENVKISNGIQYYIAWLLESLCYVAVNVFVLISAYFLSESKTYKPGKAINLIIQCWFYSVPIYLLGCLLNIVPFHFPTLITVYLFPLISGQWWFVSCYIALYLISPYLNALHRNINQYQHLGLIVILGCILCFLPTCVFWFHSSLFGLNHGYSLIWFIFLYFIASLIRKYYNDKYTLKTPWIVLYFIASFITWIVFIMQNRLLGTYYWSFYKYTSITVLIASISLFMFFRNWASQANVTYIDKIGCSLGKWTLGVYLIHMHPVISKILWKSWCKSGDIWLNRNILFCLIHLLVWSSVIFISCEIIDFIRGILFCRFEKRLSQIKCHRMFIFE